MAAEVCMWVRQRPAYGPKSNSPSAATKFSCSCSILSKLAMISLLKRALNLLNNRAVFRCPTFLVEEPRSRRGVKLHLHEISVVLPRLLRRHVFLLYAFCHDSADTLDKAGDRHNREQNDPRDKVGHYPNGPTFGCTPDRSPSVEPDEIDKRNGHRR